MTANRNAGRPRNSKSSDDLKQTLGITVMIERKKANLTQKACAEKLGICQSAWGNGEQGRTVSVERLLEMISVVNPAALPGAMNMVRDNLRS